MEVMGRVRVKQVRRVSLRAAAFLTAALLYCEFLVYYLVLWQCQYPPTTSTSPLRALVIADTHLLGSRKGHWWDKLRREWQMHRTFQTAQFYFRPSHVFFLGDLFDEGQWCSDQEWGYYVKRFHSLFPMEEAERRVHVVPGNHDMGFHYALRPHLEGRFRAAFATKSVQLAVVEGLPIGAMVIW